MNFVLSNHAIEKIEKRKIPLGLIDEVLNNPYQTYEGDGVTIFQSIIELDEKQYLLRIFVNCNKIPNEIITVYLTNKISKYLRANNEN